MKPVVHNGGLYSDHTKKRNGAEWIHCPLCTVWYHTKCQNVTDQLHFMCDGCNDSDENK
jgi:hypothetical protein